MIPGRMYTKWAEIVPLTRSAESIRKFQRSSVAKATTRTGNTAYVKTTLPPYKALVECDETEHLVPLE